MALFSRKPGITLDELYGDPAGHAAATAASFGDIDGIRTAYAGATTSDARMFVLWGVEKNLSLPHAFAWTGSEPDSADAWLSRAVVEQRLGREARGATMAKHVTAEKMREFEQHYADARRSAHRAAELAPGDPTPWWLLIRSGYAFGTANLADLLAELRSRDPWHAYGLETAVDLLGEKWYGTADEGRELADSFAAECPVGSLVPMVVAHAVREQWYYLLVFRKEKDAAAGFMTMPRTRAAVDAARLKSVDSPAHVPGPMTPLARNAFACTLFFSGRTKEAAAQLAKSNGVAAKYPWEMMGDPEALVAKAAKG